MLVSGPPSGAPTAVAAAKRALLGWHEQFSRFNVASELSALNVDPRELVPVSPLMRRVVQAARDAAQCTGGLVDPTLLGELERAGYIGHFDGAGVPLSEALAMAPARAPGRPHPRAAWRELATSRRTGTVSRPPGRRIDPGGIAKGAFADELAASLARFAAFVVDCAGDLRLGGRAHAERPVHVTSPFDDSILHTLRITAGGVATSGTGKRSWLRDGHPAHHLLDPATGEPAFTGVVQATALAPCATEAEALAKAAILSGPDAAVGWLAHGGVLVCDDGSYRVVA